MEYSDVEYDEPKQNKKRRDLRIIGFMGMVMVMILLCIIALLSLMAIPLGVSFATMFFYQMGAVSGFLFKFLNFSAGVILFALSLGQFMGVITGLIFAGKYTDELRKKL